MAAARIGPTIILASILINPSKKDFVMIVKMIIVMRRVDGGDDMIKSNQGHNS